MKTLFSFAVLLVAFLTMPAAAQHHGNNHDTDAGSATTQQDMMHEGMMQQGMMQQDMMEHCMMMMQTMHGGKMGTSGMTGSSGMMGMMQDPLHHSALLVHVLPTMKEPLELSGTQQSRLEAMMQDFTASRKQLREEAAETAQQLGDVLGGTSADPSEVESLLKAKAEKQAELQALSYKTAAEMKGVLTAEQRNMLADMNPMDMHRHMMRNMTMMEMMDAMHGGTMPMMGGSMSGMDTGHSGMMKQR